MLSKSKIKSYSLLQQKKYRKLYNLFIAEGEKTISECLKNNFKVNTVITSNENLFKKFKNHSEIKEIYLERYAIIKKISSLKTPQELIAVIQTKQYELDINDCDKRLNIVLDDIKDPGNLGTIIRIADWFGIENIICSTESVDVYNPKVVQASMGSISKVKVYYVDLDYLFKMAEETIFGTYLDGENIYKCNLSEKGYILMGNESSGIKDKFLKYIKQKIYIPPYSDIGDNIDSLNISVATGIICSEFRRRYYSK